MKDSIFSFNAFDIETDVKILSSSFCKVEPIVALSTSNQQILLYPAKGGKSHSKPINGKVNVTCLTWQPSTTNLILGWEDGILEGYVIQYTPTISKKRLWAQNTSVHRYPITILSWGFTGQLLFSGDKNGSCCLWTYENASVVPIINRQCQKEVTSVVFNYSKPELTTVFLGLADGTLLMIDTSGKSEVIKKYESSIDDMIMYKGKSKLVIITQSLHLIQLEVSDDGTIRETSKVKSCIIHQNTRRTPYKFIWIAEGVVASATGEHSIRCWDLNTDESYLIPLDCNDVTSNDGIIAINFSPIDKKIVAGTSQGRFVVWTRVNIQNILLSNRSVDRINFVHCESLGLFEKDHILSLEWGYGSHILIRSFANIGTIFEQKLRCAMTDEIVAIQMSRNIIEIQHTNNAHRYMLKFKLQIRDFVFNSNHLVAWDGEEICVYKLNQRAGEEISSFPFLANSVSLFVDSLYIAKENTIIITNMDGVQRNAILFSSLEGKPCHLDVFGDYLAVVTQKSFLKVFDVTKKDPVTLSKDSGNKLDLFGAIKSIRCNSNGRYISIIVDGKHDYDHVPQSGTQLYVHDNHRDTTHYMDFKALFRVPIAHCWDLLEPNMLSCETYSFHNFSETESRSKSSTTKMDLLGNFSVSNAKELSTLFVTESGLLIQETLSIENAANDLIGFKVPYLFLIGPSSEGQLRREINSGMKVIRKPLKYFEGVADGDETMKAMLVHLSYYLAIGNIDMACQLVWQVQNPKVWEHMANMSVLAERLDVVELCLSKMRYSRGIEAVRLAKRLEIQEMVLAEVAIQLGQIDVAKALYGQCNRYDLLNKMLQKQGMWKEALEIANNNDTLNIKNTHFEYAKHLDSVGDFSKAIKNFEQAGMQAKEIVRMYLKSNRINELEDYVLVRKDTNLLGMLAAYFESQGNITKAYHLYEKAKDYENIVRLSCHDQNYERASLVIRESNNLIAAYHLGKVYEGDGKIQLAISLYAKSELFNHAIKLAKRHNLNSELMKMALKSEEKSVILDCAKFLEEKEEYLMACRLYVQCGRKNDAIKLCLGIGEKAKSNIHLAKIFNALVNLLSANSTKEEVKIFADYLVIYRYDKEAASLLCTHCKNFEEGLQICLKGDVQVSESIIDVLTPSKHDVPPSKRKKIILQIASYCLSQKKYHLACKKFTQAGDKVEGLKCLMKSGDTPKIVSYANISRIKEIYIIAANYLQTIDWYESDEIIEIIISFYSRAQAYKQTILFLDGFSQRLIDEDGNYDKSLEICKQALNFSKMDKERDGFDGLQKLRQKIDVLQNFQEAKQCTITSPSITREICNKVLSANQQSIIINEGDYHSLMIYSYVHEERFEDALEHITKMSQRGILPKDFIEKDVLDRLENNLEKRQFPSENENGDEISTESERSND